MAKFLDDVSHTFSEYLLIPRLTKKEHRPEPISLRAPIAKFRRGETPRVSLNIPFVSAAMQAVTGPKLAITLAKMGGLGFIFCSQTVESQAEMVRAVKEHKAGFVESDSSVKLDHTLHEVLALTKRTGHSTMPVTDDGTAHGKLLGILTDKDFWEYEDDLNGLVRDYMTHIKDVVYGEEGISLRDANRLLRKHKKECLPILDKKGRLLALVFKRDYVEAHKFPDQLLDEKKRLMAAAAVNTHDYKERIPALLQAGADVICFDSSDGYTEYQKEAALWARERYGDKLVIGGGNIVSADAFRYLIEEAKLDFVKVGIGGGSICITREQKGIGRGQASAVMDVVNEREKYFRETGFYVPVISDGAITNDAQANVALAMGADALMMGRYFAMTDESPTPKISIGNRLFKPYWGEGSNRARNWQRYSEGDLGKFKFEEGVDAYVPIIGPIEDVMNVTLSKLRSTVTNCGSINLREFFENAVLTLVSEQSFIEGGTSNVHHLGKEKPEWDERD